MITLKVCDVLIDSYMRVLVRQYLSLSLDSCRIFYDIPGILIDSSEGTLYYPYFLTFPTSFEVFTDTPEVLVYSSLMFLCHQ